MLNCNNRSASKKKPRKPTCRFLLREQHHLVFPQGGTISPQLGVPTVRENSTAKANPMYHVFLPDYTFNKVSDLFQFAFPCTSSVFEITGVLSLPMKRQLSVQSSPHPLIPSLTHSLHAILFSSFQNL